MNKDTQQMHHPLNALKEGETRNINDKTNTTYKIQAHKQRRTVIEELSWNSQ